MEKVAALRRKLKFIESREEFNNTKKHTEDWLAKKGYTNGLVDYRDADGTNYSVKLSIVISELLMSENK